MKKLMILLSICFSTSLFAEEYRIITSSECTDQSKINNAGSINVKVIRNESALSLMIQKEKVLLINQHTFSVKNSFNEGKERNMVMEASSGTGTFKATILLTPQEKATDPEMKIIKVESFFDWSDEQDPPKNYHPTYQCQ